MEALVSQESWMLPKPITMNWAAYKLMVLKLTGEVAHKHLLIKQNGLRWLHKECQLYAQAVRHTRYPNRSS